MQCGQRRCARGINTHRWSHQPQTVRDSACDAQLSSADCAMTRVCVYFTRTWAVFVG